MELCFNEIKLDNKNFYGLNAKDKKVTLKFLDEVMDYIFLFERDLNVGC
jgi:hypothetical protein